MKTVKIIPSKQSNVIGIDNSTSHFQFAVDVGLFLLFNFFGNGGLTVKTFLTPLNLSVRVKNVGSATTYTHPKRHSGFIDGFTP